MVKNAYRTVAMAIFAIIFGQTALASSAPAVFVSIVPQKFFVQQIGKDLVDVRVMVEPGASPATYEPKPRQMVELSKSGAYFAVGVPFESAWLEKISATNPNMKVFHTEQGIDKAPMATHHHHDHKEEALHGHEEPDAHDHRSEHAEGPGRHDHEHARDHGILDPHVWLSPPLVKIQARNIKSGLQEIDPEHKAEYETNCEEFLRKIDELDARLKRLFEGKGGLQFMVFHPAWGYFARSYGIEQVPVEIEGKDPKPAQLMELVEHAREKGIRVIFVQPQFSTRSADLVAKEIGGQVVFADPLAENWTENLLQVADKFEQALK